MVDPTKITNYKRTEHELQELVLFCVAVAGKNATVTAKNLERLLRYCKTCADTQDLFTAIRYVDKQENFAELLRSYGFGCWRLKARGLAAVSRSGLNLRRCGTEDLEKIPGIGRKTSRFFILHSRENARVACLDTHILKWLSYYTGHEGVPTQTPSSRVQYARWEKIFLNIADAMAISPADLDLKIWNRQRGSD